MDLKNEAPQIEFRDVSVAYSNDVAALSGINLKIAPGEFVFFVGRTGAGKSTLLKLLSREIRETSGVVSINRIDLKKVKGGGVAKLRRQLGIVPQDFALLPRKTVAENVAYAMRAVGRIKREIRGAVPSILESVNISDRASAFPKQLSGGEQQRVAIARAIINRPKLILADEPTGNLDPEHSWEIMCLLRELNREGATVLVASHDVPVIERLHERIVRLDGGKIISDTPRIVEPIGDESQ